MSCRSSAALGWAFVCLGFVHPLLAVPAARGEDPQEAFQKAQALEQAGQLQPAFLAYARLPGAQHLAARLGREKPDEYLRAFAVADPQVPAPFQRLLEAELALARQDKAAALAGYRAVAKLVATDDNQDWDSGRIPRAAYLVDPPARPRGEEASAAFDFGARDWARSLTEPFAAGPGSHRDNWLIRRFIALDATADAAAEFARIWEIHRGQALPHRVEVPTVTADNQLQRQLQFVQPAGFDGRGLQFALDYFFFLKKIGRVDQALEMLREPLLAIDMDRDPNLVQLLPLPPNAAEFPLRKSPWGRFGWAATGVSRKEFVRLAYGLFKDAGRETELVTALEQKIAADQNRLRRVLARVRFHQGQTDQAIALELEFLKRADVDRLTATYRRGVAYEAIGRSAEAVAAYEEALQLPYVPPQLPDADEEEIWAARFSQAVRPGPGRLAAGDKSRFQAGVIQRLERLYGALGQPEKVLALALQQVENNPQLLADFHVLEGVRARAEALGRTAEFRQWTQRQLSAAKDPLPRAHLNWLLGEPAACARELAQAWKGAGLAVGQNLIEPWRERYVRLGKDPLRQFYTEILTVDPQNARLRLELLDLNERFEGPEVIAAFESLLAGDASFAFARGKGAWNRTRFRNYFDLTYRLLRLYEREHQLDKLRALGLRLAAGEKPFGKWWELDISQHRYRDLNDLPEDVNAAVALVLQHADANQLRKLAELWKELPDGPAKRQLQRRQTGQLPMAEKQGDLGWQALPPGVRVLASSSNVFDLARDDKYVYAGHSWGVGVYSPTGQPVARVALGEPVEALAAAGGDIWAGTSRGLFRIRRDKQEVAHIWLHGDVPEANRYASSFPGPAAYWFDNRVSTLALSGDELWIGLHRNLQRLNTRTMELRAFSFRELHVESWIGVQQIVPEREFVWAGTRDNLFRYERRTDSWERVRWGKQPVTLIGLVRGQLWANVYVDDQLRNRPALVDQRSLLVTPFQLEASSPGDRMINERLSYFGTYQGQLVFGPGGPAYVADEQKHVLRLLPGAREGQPAACDSPLPAGFRGGRIAWDPSDFPKPDAAGASPRTLVVRQESGSERWTVLLEPNGPLAAGRSYERQLDPFASMIREKRGETGGLQFFADGRPAPANLGSFADTLQGDVVYQVVADPAGKRKWLATDSGVTVLDEQDRVVATFGREDGLCSNSVTGGGVSGGRVYFSAAWGDSGGGLIEFDPATAVFSARFVSDGLATDKLAAVGVTDDSLRLVYGAEYGRGGDFHCRLFPAASWKAPSGPIRSGGPAKFFDDSTLQKELQRLRPPSDHGLPWLGGQLLGQQTLGERTYLWGACGLVILDGPAAAKLARDPSLGSQLSPITELALQPIVDPDVQLQAVARKTRITLKEPADLQPWLESPNPYLRAQALAGLFPLVEKYPRELLPLLVKASADPHVRPRSTAIYFLSRIQDAAAVPALQELLKDRDAQIRAVAALALARLDRTPALSYFEEVLTQNFGNLPFGADSSIGVQVSHEGVWEALAPHANAQVFQLYLRFPPNLGDYDNRTKVFPPLGASLRKHPDAAKLLLAAYDEQPYDRRREQFAQHVFQYAGSSMLPVLHEALQSKDRVIRSNAARACGAIGDRASIPHVIRALDLESGLSRASLVWALGELKAEAALPQLAALYVDARNDEKRGRGAGFRAGQAAAQAQSQFESLRDQKAIGSEWEELKAGASPRPVDPRRDEPLLASRDILAAVAKIGPSSSQAFYRTLAGEADAEARQEAAVRLAEAGAAERPKSLPVLRNLLADAEHPIQVAAAVSLLQLEQRDVEKSLLTWLRSANRWEQDFIVGQFGRVADGKRLAFARAALTDIRRQRTRAEEQRQLDELLARIPQP